MAYNKITEQDLIGKGNTGMPDVPMLSAAEMQAKLDQLSREVIIPRYNRLIDDLTEKGIPVQSGDIAQLRINKQGDLEISADGESWRTVADYALGLKADKETTYTKQETDRRINEKIVEIGAADMMKAVYDTDNNGVVDRSQTADAAQTADRAETAGTSDNGIFVYNQSANTLTGSGENGKFKCTAGGTYTAFTIDGESYSVTSGEETEIELVAGVTYSFILDTADKKINFKSGGGLSNSKLAQATAAAGDVLTGKTFYSGDKLIKTGTMKKSTVPYFNYSMTLNQPITVNLNGSGKVCVAIEENYAHTISKTGNVTLVKSSLATKEKSHNTAFYWYTFNGTGTVTLTYTGGTKCVSSIFIVYN